MEPEPNRRLAGTALRHLVATQFLGFKVWIHSFRGSGDLGVSAGLGTYTPQDSSDVSAIVGFWVWGLRDVGFRGSCIQGLGFQNSR